MKVTTGIYQDKRRPKKDGSFPIKLRITFNRKSKLYKTEYSFSTVDFQKIMTEKPRGEYKDLRIELASLEKDAMEIIDKLPVFTFENFEKRYILGNFDSTNLISYFEQKINELANIESYRTAEIYQCAVNSISNFHAKPKLTILDVTPEFLRKYELWMNENKRSITTTSIYLRCLRHIYNLSSEENHFDPQLYPFKKSKYKIPQPRNIKKALKLEEIKLLYEYPVEKDSMEAFYRDIWFFSYLSNGINMKDICMLKQKDIQGKHIYFRREKTKNTNRNSMPIDVSLVDEITMILDRCANPKENPEDYVFPFLNSNMSTVEIIAKVKQETKQTNKYINRIAQEVGIEKRITTYTARHSYASTLNRLGLSGTFIKEQLGHKHVSTTESYLGSFEDDAKQEIAKILLKFD